MSHAADDRKIRIAIIEDVDALRELWHVVLTPEGYEVVGYPDGESFIQDPNWRTFDIALVDLVLRPGGMHGVTVIRTASRHVICVGISGSGDTDRASAHLAGAKLVVEKPAAINGIREVIKAALALYGTKRNP